MSKTRPPLPATRKGTPGTQVWIIAFVNLASVPILSISIALVAVGIKSSELTYVRLSPALPAI